MSTVQPETPTVARSHSSRRSQSYATTPGDWVQHTSPTTGRPSAGTTPHRADSQSYSYNRPPSGQQTNLGNVARRDYEQSNVARPSSSRRSTSRDGTYAPQQTPTRADSTRSNHRSSSRPGHVRYTSDVSRAPPPATNGDSHGQAAVDPSRAPPSSSGSGKRRTAIETETGTWTLGKTIGAGSMGKVKLARNVEDGEQVAVKIVPRHSVDEHLNARDRERADHSKEIRTAREAAIVTLLRHPYICGMRDVVRTNFHWYMLFEYVNGGQMLDYIISHGRLKEKQARKFGRQIASALDYCHRNSIVHRDLKIENILISKTGDIKIIDFGLSNLFSPRNHLKTFCGSLYFAAPELLQARQYIGPEVDIWSFGIVLYVLVCGKVPFDDQSMPQLHAKIKKGVVDYPAWLTAECRGLISRMLVTEPRNRATLQEIMNHPWMTKGFAGPPENFLPPREPLQLPLDNEVIEKMTGFDFGPPDFIRSQLTKVIESEDYQHACRAAAREHAVQGVGPDKKRGVFDFYKRRSSTNSRDTLTNPSSEGLHLGTDPINAFSPLISIYYLVREKIDRERVEANPGALSLPLSPGEKPLKIPDLPAPEAAHTNAASYEFPGEGATGGRSRPRARTHGEDEVAEDLQNMKLEQQQAVQPPTIVTPTNEQPPSAKKESTAAGLLRRFSTRRHRDSERERPSKQSMPSVALQPPNDLAAAPRKSFSVRRTRDRENAHTLLHPGGSQPRHQDLLAPHDGAKGKGLGRSTSVNSADFRRRPTRRGASEGGNNIAFTEGLTSGSERSSIGRPTPQTAASSAAEQKPPADPRTAAMRTKSLGHARRESIQARRARREEAREANVPEETDQDLAEAGVYAGKVDSSDNLKPVFLKGLFSVSTTSTKPLSFIRSDIIRVLRQLGVDYTEIKGGFSCRHAPSIDLNKVTDHGAQSPERQAMQGPNHRRRISFGSFMGGDRDRDQFREDERPPQTRSSARRREGDRSFTNSEESEDDAGPPGARAVGETTTHVQNDLGENMVLRFEIFVVKVPLLTLYGVQFKKVAGGTWQYKNMAQKILNELRL